jgi:hypothetical protein
VDYARGDDEETEGGSYRRRADIFDAERPAYFADVGFVYVSRSAVYGGKKFGGTFRAYVTSAVDESGEDVRAERFLFALGAVSCNVNGDTGLFLGENGSAKRYY